MPHASQHIIALTRLRWQLYRKNWGASELVNLIWTAFLVTGGMVVAAWAGIWLYWVGRALASGEITWPFASMLVPVLLTGLFAVFWLTGLFYRTIRNDLIDPRKMLHLPIQPDLLLTLNFFYSLLTPLTLVALPAGFGFVLGANQGGFRNLGIGLLILGGFLFFHASLAFYVRGALAILVDNPRKKRLVFALITLGILFLCQLPGLVALALRSDLLRDRPEMLGPWFPALFAGVCALPPFWGALGYWGLFEGYPAVAMTGGTALWMLGFMLIRAAARQTRNYYLQGGMHNPNNASHPLDHGSVKRPIATMRDIPLLSDNSSALVWLFLTNLTRNPHTRLQGVALVATGAFLMVLFRSGVYGDEAQTFLLPLLLVWPSASLGLHILNMFGSDGAAFRGLLQLPISGIRVLRTKHLSLIPLTLVSMLLMFLVGMLIGSVSLWEILLVSLAAIPYFLTFFTLGAWTSILMPFPMTGRGSRKAMGRTASRGYRTVGILLTMLVILALSSSAGWVLDAWRRTAPVYGTVVWLLWSVGSCVAYVFTLRSAGDTLQRRWPEVAAILARDTTE